MGEHIPISVEVAKEAGAGAYTEITSVQAPPSAAAGSTVNILVTIRNKYSSMAGIAVGGSLEYGQSPWPIINFPVSQSNVAGGASTNFSGSFTMPAHDVIIHIFSYYYSSVDGSYHFDDERSQMVRAWISLATGSLSVKRSVVGGWVPLFTSSLSIKKAFTGGWVSLAAVSLPVKKAIVGGWVSLGVASLALGVGIAVGQDVFKNLSVDFEKNLPKEFESTT